MHILQSRSFKRKVRRFRKQEKQILDNQIRKIVKDPAIGQEKKGDLKGVFVHKFKIHATQYLLSYRFIDDNLELIMIGPHENYYRDFSSYIKNR
ncbi:MAG: type II toxin-antitoxin system RelE/ParE family toxin [Proteobacteria bacterium]|nr:type II toxin-antitoxin system RelE/ParE family toxin [Pseudomonadota bacterium]